MRSCSPANRDRTSVGVWSIRVHCRAECSLSQLRKGFRSPDSNIRVVRRSTSVSALLGSTNRRWGVRALEGILLDTSHSVNIRFPGVKGSTTPTVGPED